MLPWLMRHYTDFFQAIAPRLSGDSRVLLTVRISLASLLAFLICLLGGPATIRWLRRRFRERIDSPSEELNRLHANKQETPTMGGLFVMGAVLTASCVCADLQNLYVLAGIFVVLSLTILGAVDDWVKQRTNRRGLSVRQKLLAQAIIGILAGSILYVPFSASPAALSVVFPIGGRTVSLGILFVLWAGFVMTSTANAVNLTDGLDGLATGCAIATTAALTLLAYFSGHVEIANYLAIPAVSDAGEAAVVSAALVGALLGFLWFNCYPAQVFLGDTGSLPIGGLIALTALVCRQEILLIFIGGVFVAEAASVILQVGSFKLRGQRIFRCSPLHNHFVFRGDHEVSIVVRFWIVSAILAIVGLASLKLR